MADLTDDESAAFDAGVVALKDRLDADNRGIGLYLDRMMVAESDRSKTVLVFEFMVGQRAFADSVQHPEREKDKREAAKLLDEMGLRADAHAEGAAIAEKWRERRKKWDEDSAS